MKELMVGVFAVLLSAQLAAAPVEKQDEKAAAAAKKLTPQQERMKSCNKDAGAKQLKGDERKKFMSTCLKAK